FNKIKNKASSELGFLKRSCSNFNNHFAIKKKKKHLFFYCTFPARIFCLYLVCFFHNSKSINTSIQNSVSRFLSFKCNVDHALHILFMKNYPDFFKPTLSL
ncbi:Uncharacterized protein FWK35_00034604, partial [Aphis craccivora]